MSQFLAVSAIRDIVGRHGVQLERPQTDAANDARDVRLYDAGDWTIVLWPDPVAFAS